MVSTCPSSRERSNSAREYGRKLQEEVAATGGKSGCDESGRTLFEARNRLYVRVGRNVRVCLSNVNRFLTRLFNSSARSPSCCGEVVQVRQHFLSAMRFIHPIVDSPCLPSHRLGICGLLNDIDIPFTIASLMSFRSLVHIFAQVK